MGKYRRPLLILGLLAAVWIAGCKEQKIESAGPTRPSPIGETRAQQNIPTPQPESGPAEAAKPEATPPVLEKTAAKEKTVAPKTASLPPAPVVAPPAAKSIVWRTDFEAAKQAGKAQRKNLLLVFHTEWCGYCKLMFDDTFPRPEVIAFVTKNFIPVKLDAEKEVELAQRYGITGYPTTVVVNPQGEEAGRIPGYLPPQAYISTLADINRRRPEKS